MKSNAMSSLFLESSECVSRNNSSGTDLTGLRPSKHGSKTDEAVGANDGTKKCVEEITGGMLGLPQVIIPPSSSTPPSHHAILTKGVMTSPFFSAGSPGKRRKWRAPQVTMAEESTHVSSSPPPAVAHVPETPHTLSSPKEPSTSSNPLSLGARRGGGRGKCLSDPHATVMSIEGGDVPLPPSPPVATAAVADSISSASRLLGTSFQNSSSTRQGTVSMWNGRSGNGPFASVPSEDGYSSPMGSRPTLTPSFVVPGPPSSSSGAGKGETEGGGAAATIPSFSDRNDLTPSPSHWASNLQLHRIQTSTSSVSFPTGGGATTPSQLGSAPSTRVSRATSPLSAPIFPPTHTSSPSLLLHHPNNTILRVGSSAGAATASGGGAGLHYKAIGERERESGGDHSHAELTTTHSSALLPSRPLPTAVYGGERVLFPTADVLNAAMRKANGQAPIQERNIHESVQWILATNSTLDGGGTGGAGRGGVKNGVQGVLQRQREAHSNDFAKQLQSIVEARRSQTEMQHFQVALKEMEKDAFQHRHACRRGPADASPSLSSAGMRSRMPNTRTWPPTSPSSSKRGGGRRDREEIEEGKDFFRRRLSAGHTGGGYELTRGEEETGRMRKLSRDGHFSAPEGGGYGSAGSGAVFEARNSGGGLSKTVGHSTSRRPFSGNEGRERNEEEGEWAEEEELERRGGMLNYYDDEDDGVKDDDDDDEDDEDDREMEDMGIPQREERSRLLIAQTPERVIRCLTEREARRWLRTQKFLMEHPNSLNHVDLMVKKSAQHLQQVAGGLHSSRYPSPSTTSTHDSPSSINNEPPRLLLTNGKGTSSFHFRKPSEGEPSSTHSSQEQDTGNMGLVHASSFRGSPPSAVFFSSNLQKKRLNLNNVCTDSLEKGKEKTRDGDKKRMDNKDSGGEKGRWKEERKNGQGGDKKNRKEEKKEDISWGSLLAVEGGVIHKKDALFFTPLRGEAAAAVAGSSDERLYSFSGKLSSPVQPRSPTATLPSPPSNILSGRCSESGGEQGPPTTTSDPAAVAARRAPTTKKGEKGKRSHLFAGGGGEMVTILPTLPGNAIPGGGELDVPPHSHPRRRSHSVGSANNPSTSCTSSVRPSTQRRGSRVMNGSGTLLYDPGFSTSGNTLSSLLHGGASSPNLSRHRKSITSFGLSMITPRSPHGSRLQLSSHASLSPTELHEEKDVKLEEMERERKMHQLLRRSNARSIYGLECRRSPPRLGHTITAKGKSEKRKMLSLPPPAHASPSLPPSAPAPPPETGASKLPSPSGKPRHPRDETKKRNPPSPSSKEGKKGGRGGQRSGACGDGAPESGTAGPSLFLESGKREGVQVHALSQTSGEVKVKTGDEAEQGGGASAEMQKMFSASLPLSTLDRSHMFSPWKGEEAPGKKSRAVRFAEGHVMASMNTFPTAEEKARERRHSGTGLSPPVGVPSTKANIAGGGGGSSEDGTHEAAASSDGGGGACDNREGVMAVSRATMTTSSAGKHPNGAVEAAPTPPRRGFKLAKRKEFPLPAVEGVGRRYAFLIRHSTLALRRTYVNLERECGEDAERTSRCLEQLFPLREELLVRDLMTPYRVTHPLQWEEKYLKRKQKEERKRSGINDDRKNSNGKAVKELDRLELGAPRGGGSPSPLLLLPPESPPKAVEREKKLEEGGREKDDLMEGGGEAIKAQARWSSPGSSPKLTNNGPEKGGKAIIKRGNGALGLRRNSCLLEEKNTIPVGSSSPYKGLMMTSTPTATTITTATGVAEEMRGLCCSSKSLPSEESFSTGKFSVKGREGEPGRGVVAVINPPLGTSSPTKSTAKQSALPASPTPPFSWSCTPSPSVSPKDGSAKKSVALLTPSDHQQQRKRLQFSSPLGIPVPHVCDVQEERNGKVSRADRNAHRQTATDRKGASCSSSSPLGVPFIDPQLMLAKHREIIFKSAKIIDEEERRMACLAFVDCLEKASKDKISSSTWIAVEEVLECSRQIVLSSKSPRRNQQNFEGFTKMVSGHFTVDQLVEWPVQEMLRRLCGIFFVSPPQYRDWMAGMYQKVSNTHDYEGKFRAVDLTIKNKIIPKEAFIRITLHRARRLPRVDLLLLLNEKKVSPRAMQGGKSGEGEGGGGGSAGAAVTQENSGEVSGLQGLSVFRPLMHRDGGPHEGEGVGFSPSPPPPDNGQHPVGSDGADDRKTGDRGGSSSLLQEGSEMSAGSPLSSLTMANEWKKTMKEQALMRDQQQWQLQQQQRDKVEGGLEEGKRGEGSSASHLFNGDSSKNEDLSSFGPFPPPPGAPAAILDEKGADSSLHILDCTTMGSGPEHTRAGSSSGGGESGCVAREDGLASLAMNGEGIEISYGKDEDEEEWSTETEKAPPVPEYAVRMKVERQVITSSAVPAGNSAASGDEYGGGMEGDEILDHMDSAVMMINSKNNAAGSNSVAARQKVYFYDQTFRIHLYDIASVIDVELLSDGTALSSGHLSMERHLHWKKSTIWLPLRGLLNNRLTELQMTIEVL